MGTIYAFRCPRCAYTAEVSGGPDCGFSVGTVTISCATCRKLRDVVVTHEPWKNPPDPVPEHPRCTSSRTRVHHTVLWRDPGPCPRCALMMVNDGETLLWD